MSDNKLYTDSDPEPPRPSVEMEEQSVAELEMPTEAPSEMDMHIQRDLGAPTPDWSLKTFLLEIANELTKEDLEKLKFLFSGIGGLGKAVLEKVKEPHQLFDLLLTRSLLSRDNLLVFQRALMTVQRMDIIDKAVEYAQTIGNTLHFYPADVEPVNGYRRGRFHIRGHNYQTCTRDQIQAIRLRLAERLFTSPECILIEGVEPANSLILTLDMPEPYFKILIFMLEKRSYHPRLKEIGIDIVEIPDLEKIFHISDPDQHSKVLSEQQKRLQNIYEQFEKTRKQLEDSEVARLDLQERVNRTEKERFEQEAILKTKLQTLSDEKDRPELATEAFKDFEKQLQRPELDSYDKKLLLSLIDANSRFVSGAVAEGYKLMEDKMKLWIRELEIELQPLRFELMKLRAFSRPECLEQYLLYSFRQFLESFVPAQQLVPVEINADFLEVLKKISNGLRCSEKGRLENIYEWSQDDDVKKLMEKDSSFFLAGLLMKEIQKTRGLVDAEKFIIDILEKAKRTDLQKKFAKLYSSLKASRAKHATGTTQPSQGERQRSRSLERQNEPSMKVDEVMKLMADQVSRMHEIIVTAHKQIPKPGYVGNLFGSKRRSLFSDEEPDVTS